MTTAVGAAVVAHANLFVALLRTVCMHEAKQTGKLMDDAHKGLDGCCVHQSLVVVRRDRFGNRLKRGRNPHKEDPDHFTQYDVQVQPGATLPFLYLRPYLASPRRLSM
jgi:hypothetical protein